MGESSSGRAVRERKSTDPVRADLAPGRCSAGGLPAEWHGRTSGVFLLTTLPRTDPGSLFRRQSHLETLGRVALPIHETGAASPISELIHNFEDQDIRPFAQRDRTDRIQGPWEAYITILVDLLAVKVDLSL